MSGSAPWTDRDALEEALVRSVLDDLPTDEAEALARLLAGRPDLEAELQSLGRTFDLLPHAVAMAPPPSLRGRVLEAAGGTARKPGASTQPFWRVLAAAASLAAAVLSIQVLDLRRQLRLQSEVTGLLQQPNVVLTFSMKGAGSSPGAYGSVVLDLDARKGAVAIRELSALPVGRVYRLWALVAGKKVPCGQFNADANDGVASVFAVPVDAYTAPVTQLVLTIESSDAPWVPAGPTVMVGSTKS